MNKNQHLTQLDPNQIATLEHDDSKDAKRVTIVDDINISFDENKMLAAIKEGLKDIKFDSKGSQVQIVEIEKPVFITKTEIKEIEKQVIIKEIEYREIEKPVYIEKIITIEKPIVIKEVEFRDVIKERHYPLIMKVSAVIQAICVLSLLIFNILKK